MGLESRDLVFPILSSIVDMKIIETNTSFWLLLWVFIGIMTPLMTVVTVHKIEVFLDLLVFYVNNCIYHHCWSIALLASIISSVSMRIVLVWPSNSLAELG